MRKVKSQLRFGQWPAGRAEASVTPELSIAAKRLAADAIEMLRRNGVVIGLEGKRVRFTPTRSMPMDARRAIELHAALIETFLIEQARTAIDAPPER